MDLHYRAGQWAGVLGWPIKPSIFFEPLACRMPVLKVKCKPIGYKGRGWMTPKKKKKKEK